MKHVVFSTDVTPHRLWVHQNVDLYLVTSEVAERAVRRFQPDAQVLVVQAPVREPFYHPPTQQAARDSFGVPPRERCVLLTTGAWGLGPVAQAAEALADAGVHVLAVAGRNPKLEQRLRTVADRQPLVQPFGFTDRIPDLMAASDLVITSSGDTCTEARVIGRPLLLLDVVQGHGRDNLQHELELGDAAVASGRATDVVRATLAALESTKPPPSVPTRSRDAWHSSLTAALATVGL
jgi:processive 1,2-diacylglycerol beta-glucosyltransferase